MMMLITCLSIVAMGKERCECNTKMPDYKQTCEKKGYCYVPRRFSPCGDKTRRGSSEKACQNYKAKKEGKLTAPEEEELETTTTATGKKTPEEGPEPSKALAHGGEDCHQHCRYRSGPCAWCGSGKCCRKRYKGGENGCGITEGGVTNHQCVGPTGTDSTKETAARPVISPKADDIFKSSSYLNYGIPNGGDFDKGDAMFATIRPQNSTSATYFKAIGFKNGYIGMQQNDDKPEFTGRIIFSVWDNEGCLFDKFIGDMELNKSVVENHQNYTCWREKMDDPYHLAIPTECGNEKDITCMRFDGVEDQGAQVLWYYNDWRVDRDYSFMVRTRSLSNEEAYIKRKDQNDKRKRYVMEAYFLAEDKEEFGTGNWKLIAKIEYGLKDEQYKYINDGDQHAKNIGLLGNNAFIERYSANDFFSDRYLQTGPVYVHKFGHEFSDPSTWRQVTSAIYETSGGKSDPPLHNGKVSADGKRWEWGFGGSIRPDDATVTRNNGKLEDYWLDITNTEDPGSNSQLMSLLNKTKEGSMSLKGVSRMSDSPQWWVSCGHFTKRSCDECVVRWLGACKGQCNVVKHQGVSKCVLQEMWKRYHQDMATHLVTFPEATKAPKPERKPTNQDSSNNSNGGKKDKYTFCPTSDCNDENYKKLCPVKCGEKQ